jgi:hypothetical protein
VSRADELGSCRLWVKGDAGAYVLHPRHYPEARAAWLAGKPFFEGTDLYGDVLIVKLGEVTGMALWTPGAIREARAEAKADELLGES